MPRKDNDTWDLATSVGATATMADTVYYTSVLSK
jgi:O-methyltransferase involved in polyketide biosynthesis